MTKSGSGDGRGRSNGCSWRLEAHFWPFSFVTVATVAILRKCRFWERFAAPKLADNRYILKTAILAPLATLATVTVDRAA